MLDLQRIHSENSRSNIFRKWTQRRFSGCSIQPSSWSCLYTKGKTLNNINNRKTQAAWSPAKRKATRDEATAKRWNTGPWEDWNIQIGVEPAGSHDEGVRKSARQWQPVFFQWKRLKQALWCQAADRLKCWGFHGFCHNFFKWRRKQSTPQVAQVKCYFTNKLAGAQSHTPR